MSAGDLAGLHSLFIGWMHACHAAARRRNGMAFVESDDIRETWQAALQQRDITA